jgi:hypothetical protein
MRTVKVNWFAAATVFVGLGLALTTYADEALTARNKALVRNFYANVLIQRKIDAAPQFRRTDYIQHDPNVPTGLKGFMDTFRERFAQKLPPDYKRELQMLSATTTWLSSMCDRRGRALTGNTI